MKFKVACIQTSSGEDPKKNILKLENLFQKTFKKKPDLICLPECVSLLTDSKKILGNYSVKKSNEFVEFVKKKAQSNSCYILIGSLSYKNKNNKFFNRSILISPEGKLLIYYDKINLFDVTLSEKEIYLESNLYDPGKKICVYNLPWGKIGFTICYDLRFPLLYKKLSKKGSIFLSIPAAFTQTTGKAHWESLLRARAIENGCYVFAPAQCGKNTTKRRTFGNSMIIDPWGKILAKANNDPTVIFADVQVDLVKKVRAKIPSTMSF